MSNRTYAIFVWLGVFILFVYAGVGNPYGDRFVPRVVPVLLLLASLQWLLLSTKFSWQIAGSCAAFAAAVMILSWRDSSIILTIDGHAKVVFLLMLAQLVSLLLLAPDRSARSIVVAQTLSIAFIILLGTYFSTHPFNVQSTRTVRFLFWSPLAALSLWINGAVSGWRKSTRIIFICLVVQPCIGFLSMGGAQDATWMRLGAVVFFLAAFGFVIGWAEELNK